VQCSIPVFEGLLPEPHNTIVLKLLFTMAHWHGLAKLRMHSDLTLDIMDLVTTAVGQQFREFKAKVCAAYTTRELHQEVEARARHYARQAAKQNGVRKGKQVALKNVQRTKIFNFQTYKFHALGDYVSTIRRYGTSDSYSSEPVRPCHLYMNIINYLVLRVNLSTGHLRPCIAARIASNS
jgi:hypothetical protein